MAVTYKIERITPGRAKTLLKTQKTNRPLQSHTVSLYADQMRRNLWDANNGESIKLNGNGKLIDGQHRLAAIIRCGKTIRMTVAYGVSSRAFETLDTGRKRSLGDVLSLTGHKNYHNLASAIRAAMSLKTKPYFYLNPTNAEGLAWMEKHPKLAESLHFVYYSDYKDKPRRTFASLVGVGRLSGLHYVGGGLRDSDRDTADYFVDRILNGDELKRGSPILLYRHSVMETRDKQLSLDRRTSLLWMVKTWNAWRMGTKLDLRVKASDNLKML